VETRAGRKGPGALGRGTEQTLGPHHCLLDLVPALQDLHELAHQERQAVGVAGDRRLPLVRADQRAVVAGGARHALETAQGRLVSRLAVEGLLVAAHRALAVREGVGEQGAERGEHACLLGLGQQPPRPFEVRA
jgi:hypothetical protein